MTGDVALKTMDATEWAAFLRQHDMLWTSVNDDWKQGAFLGNGMIGAMVYKDSPNVMRWELGRCDVVEYFQIPLVDWAPARIRIGDLLLKCVGNIQRDEMRLDLYNAELKGKIVTDRGTITWRSVVHTEDMAVLIDMETTGDEDGAEMTFHSRHGVSPCLAYDHVQKRLDQDWLKAHTPPLPVSVETTDGGCSYQDLMGGGRFSVAWKQSGTASKRSLYAAIAWSYPARDSELEARQMVADVMAKDKDAWLADHYTWWNNFYPQSFLSLNDTYWESFYWLQMYKLASATRSDRALIDSQGPWLTHTPWPTCVWNLNVELSYSPLSTANRCELGESLYGTLDAQMSTLIMNVPDCFRHDAAGMGRASSCADLSSRTSAGWETGNLTWVCHNYYRHYRATMDEEMLRNRFYPLLRRAICLYFHIMEEWPDGKIHLPKTISPEYGPDKPTRNCNYDLALFRWGCRTLLNVTERLGVEDDRKADWEDVLERLIDAPVNENGLMIGSDFGYDLSHRHCSHLFSIFPLQLQDKNNPEQLALIEQSIERWLSLQDELQGYTYTLSSSMMSRLGKGDKALEMLNGLKTFLHPNSMYFENGPVIETPINAAESMQDMLLQSWTNPNLPGMQSIIRVFPAVSAEWSDIVFNDFRAEGAFLVSAKREAGKTQWISITSEAGEPCRVLLPADAADLPASKPVQVQDDGTVIVELAKGETVLFGATDADLTVAPVKADPKWLNTFGMNSDNHICFIRAAH